MNNQTLLIALAIGAWYFLAGPGKKPATATPPGTTPPQTPTVTGAGSAVLGSCPPNLSQEQCSKYLSERIGLEKEKAWAGVAGEGIKQGGSLLGKIFGG